MRSIGLSLLMALVTTAGCATMRNTPAQDLAWERWQACDHFTNVRVERVDLDGRLVVWADANQVMPITKCVQEAAAGQGGRGAAAEPQALVLVKIFGCMGGPG
jgi:hypothetical protein